MACRQRALDDRDQKHSVVGRVSSQARALHHLQSQRRFDCSRCTLSDDLTDPQSHTGVCLLTVDPSHRRGTHERGGGVCQRQK
ncbi:hypothetical protein PAMA_019206 [Pampus argenteus]